MAKRTGFENRVNNAAKATRVSIIRSKEEVARESALYEAQEEQAIKEQEINAIEAERKKLLKYKVPTRKTYLLDPISVRALEFFATDEHLKLSSAITGMLLKYIPKEYWIKARNDIIREELTTDDYLDDVKKPTIDDVYFHVKDK